MIYLKLFLSFLQVGLFSIGGGYAAIPLIQAQVVENEQWLTTKEFTDLVSIAEMTPGPISINAATFTGIRIAGIPGALAATAGCIFPSLIIVSILAFIYYKFKGLSFLRSVLESLRPAVVALIASAGINILTTVLWGTNEISLKDINWIGAILFVASFIVLKKFKLSPIIIMLSSGALGLVSNLILNAVVK